MKPTLLLPAVFLTLSALACSTPKTDAKPDDGRGMGMGMGMHAMHGAGKDACPMTVAGTSVVAEDVDGGAALVFHTTGDVAALRTRVAAMVEHHNGMHDGKPTAKMPSSKARAEDTDDGARLVITPEAAGDLDAVRARVHKHAEMMKDGTCPMMNAPAT